MSGPRFTTDFKSQCLIASTPRDWLFSEQRRHEDIGDGSKDCGAVGERVLKSNGERLPVCWAFGVTHILSRACHSEWDFLKKFLFDEVLRIWRGSYRHLQRFANKNRTSP